MHRKIKSRSPTRDPDTAEGQSGNVESLLRALACALVPHLAPLLAAQIYDQRPGHLPADVPSADAYMRRHRALRKAGASGVWVRGKLLCCTGEGWSTELPKVARPKLAIVMTAPDDAIDAELGIRVSR